MKLLITVRNQTFSMKYIEEYRNKELIIRISEELARVSKTEINLMEVCGGHTMSIHRFGLPSLLPATIKLLSGPGCPVCVSGQHFLDHAIALSEVPGAILTTYGDLIRVPGSSSSLEKKRAEGYDIRIVYSLLDALRIAKENPDRPVFFPGIGFETTAPATAAAILQAKKEAIKNFHVLSAHKIMPPVMKKLVEEGVNLHGFIAPGHVTTITGTSIYHELTSVFKLGVLVTGFEPADLMQAILMLVRQVESGSPKTEIQYRRVVHPEGNKIAQRIMNEVFSLRDDQWRGLGTIAASGYKIKETYSDFDAEVRYPMQIPIPPEPKNCLCGSILRGIKTPNDCKLFATACTPVTPVGACMVSGEGTCATYYKYRP